MKSNAKDCFARVAASDLGAQAKVLFGLLCAHANEHGQCALVEADVAAVLGIGTACLRRYRGSIVKRGFAELRVRAGILYFSLNWENCAEDARSVQDTREVCKSYPVTLPLASPAEEPAAAQSVQDTREVCKVCTLRAPAEGREVGYKDSWLINNTLPPPNPPPVSLAGHPLAGLEIGEFERNLRLLADPLLAISNGAQVERLAGLFRFDELFLQCVDHLRAVRRDVRIRDPGGVLVGRLAARVRDRRKFGVSHVRLDAVDRSSDFYRRHMVLAVATEEPPPEQAIQLALPAAEEAPGSPEPVLTEGGLTWPEVWDAARSQCRLQMARAVYDTWLREVTPQRRSGPEAPCLLICRNEQTREWIEHRLAAMLQRAVASIAGRPIEFGCVVSRCEPAGVER